MRLKKIAAIILGCSVLVSSMSAFADSTASSAANIKFSGGTGPTKPVDPDTKDPDPDKPEVGGSLSIVSVSDFTFNGKISSGTEFYDVQTERPNVQVVDLRGTSGGWDLNAKLSHFTDDGDNISLIGTSLHIYDGRLNSDTSMEFAPSVSRGIKLTSDSEQARIMTAEQGRGMGLWIDRFYPEDAEADGFVQLEVLSAIVKADSSHQATITWILSTTP